VERIGKLENTAIEIIQSGKQRKNRLEEKKTDHIWWDISLIPAN
jgi:hypothetical protein